MKKILRSILFIVMMSFVFVGCGVSLTPPDDIKEYIITAKHIDMHRGSTCYNFVLDLNEVNSVSYARYIQYEVGDIVRYRKKHDGFYWTIMDKNETK